MFTKLEMKVMKALDNCEFGDYVLDEVWTFSVSDDVCVYAGDENMSKASFSGVMSSLNKKGYVYSSVFTGRDAYDNVMCMTEEGFKAYVKAVGVDNVVKYYDESLLP